MTGSSTLIVGLGSPHGDDRVGWHVAERLAASIGAAARVKVAADPTTILDWLDGVTTLHICDACQTFREPGTIHCWRWPRIEHGNTQSTCGSHGVSLQAVLSLAECMGWLPARVKIWAVEMAAAESLAATSAAALAAADRLAQQIAKEVADA